MMEPLSDCYLSALGAMETSGPKPLLPRVQLEAAERRPPVDVGLDALCESLRSAPVNHRLRQQLHLAVARWDAASADADWPAGTASRSPERRAVIYERLGLASHSAAPALFDELFHLQTESPVVISDTFEPWYTTDRQSRHAFYWPAYSGLLKKRGWGAEAISGLDEATTRVIERLTDPLREQARQAKGLVVGYVQSGKTANFTGVIAKSVDAGYRLIIVLTGTIDVLRRQTQRRIDMELVGKQNIVGGVDAGDADLMAQVDYQDDPDWDDKFIDHGVLPSTHGFPDIVRLTNRDFDYRSLRNGILAFEFEKVDKTQPLWSPRNLPTSSARLVIVKKNKTVLQNLVKDLRSIKTPRHEIPALVIDDESDQASVNTTDPQKWAADLPAREERTAINKSISHLLTLLPRAQYVGYTATPFANVFIDPSDADDIFPKDFLISLPRPEGYMGVRDFHDIDCEVDPDQRTFANSNERAYVRDVREDDGVGDEAKLQESVDAFVLSGAIKLFRSSAQGNKYRHHTMLVHASVKQTDHANLAREIRSIWQRAGYGSPSCLPRLQTLYDTDFLPVCRARAGEDRFPDDFNVLKQFIGPAISKITSSADPVLVVNGDKEMASEEIDFDKREVWRILVGGTKLSRGFTVEGLTISYYRRKAKQADTLMQMGRWFGFRPGYKDLVRLYIGREEPDGKTSLDLYEAFDAIVRDEEAFRDQLRQYSEMVDGKPQLTPKEIPPLVSQHLPWLKPAARNKMFNAELVIRRAPGKLVIPYGYPTDSTSNSNNYAAIKPLLAAAAKRVSLRIPLSGTPYLTFEALIGELSPTVVLQAIEKINWVRPDYFLPEKAYLNEIVGEIEKWIVIAPQLPNENYVRELPDIGPRYVFKRQLRSPNVWREPTDSKHRPAAQSLAGGYVPSYDDDILNPLKGARTASMLIYPMCNEPSKLAPSPHPREVVLAIAWATPASLHSAGKQVVQFRARNYALAEEVTVPAD